MVNVEVRGSKQWAAVGEKCAMVEELDAHGPASLSLDGIERMVNLRRVWFVDRAPTDQLYRLKGLRSLDRVWVNLESRPHDLASLLECRIASLWVTTFNVRRALELAALPYHRVEGLTSLRLDVHAPAMIPWDCGWLADAAGSRELMVTGVYAWPETALAALRSARQLRVLSCHPNEGGDFLSEQRAQEGAGFSDWQAEMQAALPDTVVHPSEWLPGLPSVDRRWDMTEI